MRIRVFVLSLLWFVVAVHAPKTAAQDAAKADTVQVVELRLHDGSRLVGSIQSETETEIVFRLQGGAVLHIRVDQVESRRAVTIRDGRYLTPDPNVTRLFFTATGRPVASGTGYFADYWVFFPFLAYGVGNVATLAGGVSLIPGSSEQLLYLAPKLTPYHGDRVSVSMGVLAGTLTGDPSWGGLLYGVSTFGSADDALTLGVGFAWGGGDIEDSPIFLVGGEMRIGGGAKLISENYVIPALDGILIVSGGVRFFGETLAADLGFFTSPDALDEGGFPFLPWVGFAYNFGH